MSSLLTVIVFLLFLNAGVAFVIAFVWHAKVISALSEDAPSDKTLVLWKALSGQGSPKNRFCHFLAREIYPDMRRKWERAVGYVAYSFILLFAVVGSIEISAPKLV